MARPTAQEILDSIPDLTWGKEDGGKPLCRYAAIFNQWCEEELGAALQTNPSLPDINRCKALLQDQWWAWRESMPGHHRFCVNPDLQHPGRQQGIWDVYALWYRRLQRARLEAVPPEYDVRSTGTPLQARKTPWPGSSPEWDEDA